MGHRARRSCRMGRAAAQQAGAFPLEEQERWEEGLPGSAGVPPACTAVAWRSVFLRSSSQPPCRREPHGLGRSRALAPLPVGRVEEMAKAMPRLVRAGRPRSRVGSTPRGRRSKGGSSVFVSIRLHERSAVYSRLFRTAGRQGWGVGKQIHSCRECSPAEPPDLPAASLGHGRTSVP